mmetsp:Transcript_25941/g.52334  ORF Transcript_25941/g.52334 Transcript_25941/m.52334 type:complete len:222 (-) Transcript_25941:17-682(-)
MVAVGPQEDVSAVHQAVLPTCTRRLSVEDSSAHTARAEAEHLRAQEHRGLEVRDEDGRRVPDELHALREADSAGGQPDERLRQRLGQHVGEQLGHARVQRRGDEALLWQQVGSLPEPLQERAPALAPVLQVARALLPGWHTTASPGGQGYVRDPCDGVAHLQEPRRDAVPALIEETRKVVAKVLEGRWHRNDSGPSLWRQAVFLQGAISGKAVASSASGGG